MEIGSNLSSEKYLNKGRPDTKGGSQDKLGLEISARLAPRLWPMPEGSMHCSLT